MSLTAAASGFVVFLLSVSVILGQNDWGVTYSSTEICALKGSTVNMSCTYRYPSTVKTVENGFWFTKESNGVYTDLKTDPEYSHRVEYKGVDKDCTLRITDLRESDSAEYKFRFITDQPGGSYSGSPGVTLRVTDLQVKVSRSSYNWRELKCHSSCRLPDRSSYIWYKNGEKIQSQTSSTYSNYFNSTDSYSCAVEGHEDFPSPPVCVNDRPCDRVIYTDRSICAFKGSSVDISCTYSSSDTIRSKFWFSPERSHQWQSPSQPDSQFAGRVQVFDAWSGRSTLRITDLTESDSAQYHFKFTAGSFEWRSSLPATTLTVTALQVQVTRTTVHQSDTEAELKCHSSCSPAGRLSYVWFKNRQKVMKEESSVYKDRFYPGDNISCALMGHETYGSPLVYALKLPSVSVSPSAEIVEGSSMTLTCSSDANPAANYTWYKKNGDTDLQPLSKEPQLVFSSIQSSDSGEYHCTAENELGRRTSEYISINVTYASKTSSVSVSPPAEIVEGSSVTLTCSSDANPAAKYTWYKENQEVFQGQEGSYNFSSISSEDRGNYSCKSENQHGRLGSESVFIDVQYAPRLPSVSVSPSAEIVEGSSVTLTCSSDANPAAKYTWYKENEDSPTASGQIFTITDFRAEHSGNVSCEAQNRRGRNKTTVHLTVVTGSGKSVAAGTITVVLLAIISLSVFLWIRKKRTSRESTEAEERPDDREHGQPEEQDDFQYATIHFSNNQADNLYSNIRPAQPRRHVEQQEVEYAAVRCTSASTAPRARGQGAAEDPAVLYSTVNKTR